MFYARDCMTTQRQTDGELASCPFNAALSGTCMASLSSITIDPVLRQGYCENENYDNCPMFLSKIMRKKG